MKIKDKLIYEEEFKDEVLAQTEFTAREEFVHTKKEIYSRVRFIRDLYQKQLNSIPKRINLARLSIFTTIAMIIIILAIMYVCIFMYGKEIGFLFGSILIAPLIKVIYMLVFDILNYNVQMENQITKEYRRKREIITLKEEKRYCESQIIKYNNYLFDIETLPEGGSFDKYRILEYKEKRADDLSKKLL